MYFDGVAMPQLSLQDRLHILDNLAAGGVNNLSLLGGEPLTLANDLYALLQRAREHQIKFTIVTNGLLLKPDISRRLIDYGVSRLVVSVESPLPQIHNKIRGKRTFERLMDNLEAFMDLRGMHTSPKLTINTVLCRPNRNTFIQMIPFCHQLGADEWNALTLNHIGNAYENLENLAISQAEHTEVAIEMGRLLQSPDFDDGRFKVNFTIVYPLVWEYLCKKYGIDLPQPQICCSAAASLAYISPTGDLHLCDRVMSSGYTGSKLESETMQPVSLLDNSFEDIWNSRQYIEMFNFVKRAETYKGFHPCDHCKYFFDRTCNPCPLQAYRSEHIQFEECLKAEKYLGDISRYDDGPRTPWEEMHQFEPIPLTTYNDVAYNQIRHGYPVPVRGLRHALEPNDDKLLMHPSSLQLIRFNAIGTIIWDSMTGVLTTDEVVDRVVQLYTQVYETFHVTPDKECVNTFKKKNVQAFILSLSEKDFIEFNEAPVVSAINEEDAEVFAN